MRSNLLIVSQKDKGLRPFDQFIVSKKKGCLTDEGFHLHPKNDNYPVNHVNMYKENSPGYMGLCGPCG